MKPVNGMTISASATVLPEIKAVTVKFPSGIGMFRIGSAESDAVLKRLDVPVPERILTGTLPEMDWYYILIP